MKYEHFDWSWILLFLVQELFRCSNDWFMLAHPAQFCSLMLSWLPLTGTCLLILPSFVPCCTRLAHLNVAHLLRPKGTLGKEQDNNSFKSYKPARCPQAPSRRRHRAPTPPAPRAPRICVWKSCCIALKSWGCSWSRHWLDRCRDGSFAARRRSQAFDADITIK
jgi:hypothetical protein